MCHHIKDGHIAHNTLHRALDVDSCEQQVRIDSKRIPGLLVFVVFGNTLDSCHLAAFMGIGIGKDDSLIQSDFGVQPTVPVRGKTYMVFLKQQDTLYKPLLLLRRMFHTLFPVVEAAARDADSFAEQLNGKLTGKLHHYLVLFLPIGMNFLCTPTPSTR